MAKKLKPLYDPEKYLRDKRARKQAAATSRDVRADPGARTKKMKAPVGKGGR